MAYPGKRKRSEKAKSQHDRRLRLLALLYTLFLIPCILNLGTLLAVGIAIVLAFGVLLLDSYFILRDKQSSSNLLVSLTTTALTIFAWLLFTVAAGIGLLMWAHFLSVHSSSLDEIFTSAFIVLTVIPSVCIPFTYELQVQMIEWMSQIQHNFAEQKQQPNVAVDSAEHELEIESEIPLELLAEAESAEQAQR